MKSVHALLALELNEDTKIRKGIMSFFVLLLLSSVAIAQSGTSFGFKGGINYSANGDYFESIGQNAQTPDRNIGYHVGIFGKFGSKFFFRPELVYTSTKSDYNNDSFDIKKIDAPLLIGAKIIGPINVFAGPSLQYILDSEFEGINVINIENEFSIGLNFGIGFTLKKVGIDLRYERGFSNNEANFIDNNFGQFVYSRIDTRPDQLILSLSVAL